MNYGSRLYLYAPIALLLVILGVAGLHWWVVARGLEARLDGFQTREAMPGVTVRYGARDVGGFPFRIEVSFRDLRIAVESERGPIVWRAEKFALHGLAYGRDQLVFEAAGAQSLQWRGRDGKLRTLDFQTGATHASAILRRGALSRFDLDIVGFGSRAFTADRLQAHMRRTASGLDIAASASGVRLSPGLSGGFGPDVRLAALEAAVSAPRAFDGLLAGRTDWRRALEAWRNASGGLALDPLEFDFDRLSMLGRGSVSLDAERRPQGAVDFKIAGFGAWLARGVPVRPGSFAAALRDRAAKAGDDGAGRMGALVGAKDGIVYVGDEAAGFADPLY
jgi:hypothetical protein